MYVYSYPLVVAIGICPLHRHSLTELFRVKNTPKAKEKERKNVSLSFNQAIKQANKLSSRSSIIQIKQK